MPVTLCEGRRSPCLVHFQPWSQRQSQKLSESRITGGDVKVDGDVGECSGGVWYPMGERVDWMDPGVYVGIKWVYYTRMRTVGRGLREGSSSALGSEGSLEGEREYG